MPRFLGLEIQTDVRCASGARVAFFPAGALLACGAVLSPTEPESLTATIQRSDARAVEVVAGRVVRTCFSDTAYDREWDIVELGDADHDDQLTLTAQPIALRLARKLYETVDGATGAPVTDFTVVGVTASEAIDDYVLPTLTAAGMSWVSRGTVDPAVRFDLSGQWASALEIVRAIAEPGRANGEWQLRRNGDAGYLLDVVDAIGSAASTLRVRTAHNLLTHDRSRSVLEAVTRVFPRGSDLASQRTMADHLWAVDSVVSGTVLQLADIQGGAGPIAYDDQLNGLYIASMDSATFAAVQITDSVAATQRVTVSSTAGFTAGKWCRLFVGSTANGRRLTSLTNPVQAAAPSAGGLGDLGEFLDVPETRADCNLVPNPWMRDWTTAASPPDNWTESAGTPANRSLSRETTTVRDGSPYAFRLQTSGNTTLYVETPDIPVWAISGRRHFPAIWFYVDAVPAATASALIFDLYTAAGVKLAEIGRWVRGATPVEDTWFRVEGAVQDLSAVTGKVRIRVTVGTTTSTTAASGWNLILSHALLAESEVPVEDIEYSGGTVLWQAANARLLAASAPVRGQELTVADLEADDPDVFGSLLVVPGQSCELTDTVLAEVTTQRVLEYRPDYLVPLASQIRVGIPAASAVQALVDTGITPAADPGATPGSEMLALEGSFDEDGQLFVRVIGDADTASLYVAVATGTEPTEATLMQATPVNGRQGEFTFPGPYDLGEAVYVAARGSSAVNGRGGLSDVIRARLVRGNSATAKTIRLPGAAVFSSADGTTELGLVNSGYYEWTLGSPPFHHGALPVPKNVTLTAVRARTYCADTGGTTADELYFSLDRLDGDGAPTDIGGGDVNSVADAWETQAITALSESTSGERSYNLKLSGLNGTGIGTNPALRSFRCAWVEYDIDVPNLDATT